MRHSILLILAGLAVVGDSSASEPDSANITRSEPRLALYLPRVAAIPEQSVDTVSLMIQTDSIEIAGFDLKIGCDSRLVTILEILPGQVIDSCNWEYFHARDLTTQEAADRPVSLWKILGLAKSSPGPDMPTCYGFDHRAALFNLVLTYETEAFALDTSVSLFFYWEDCRDNVLADRIAVTALMSSQVYSYYGGKLEADEGFPSRTGAPRQCVDLSKPNRPLRLVDFHNGGVEFEFIGELHEDTPLRGGDTNSVK